MRITPEVFNKMAEMQRNRERKEWEVARMQAAWIIQPFCKGRINLKKHMPLPWDEAKPMAEADRTTREEAYARFKRLTGITANGKNEQNKV